MDLEETFNILYKKVDKHLTWMVEIFTHVGRWGGLYVSHWKDWSDYHVGNKRVGL